MFAFADPTELWLEIAPTTRADAWQQANSRSNNRWNSYINQVCLEAVLHWVQTEQNSHAAAWEVDHRPIWEVVDGSVICVNNTRVALIPTEAIDDGELAVPQEWIDIPGWVADYYLAIQTQLEPEESWIRVWGYATHQQLKTGQYDANDRTYCLAADQLTQDWSALWVTMRFCSEAQTRVPLPALPDLSPTQAENLIQRLGNPELTFPRLTVPFELWGALLENSAWRQQLYQRRTQTAARVNLRQWLQQQATTGWQILENLLPTESRLAFNFRSAAEPADAIQGKLIELAGQTVALVIQLNQEADGRVAILVQIHPAGGETVVPEGLRLSLIAETGEVLQTVQASSQDSYIQLRRFRCPEDTAFQVQIELAAAQAIESFRV